MSLLEFLVSLILVMVLSVIIFGYRRMYNIQGVPIQNKVHAAMDILIVIIVLGFLSSIMYLISNGGLIVCLIAIIANFLLIGLAIEVGMLNTIKTIGIVIGAIIAIFPYGNKVLSKMRDGQRMTLELFENTEKMLSNTKATGVNDENAEDSAQQNTQVNFEKEDFIAEKIQK